MDSAAPSPASADTESLVDAPYDFDIRSDWTLIAEPEELTPIILDPELLPLWCPSAFLKGELLDPGDSTGLGMKMLVRSKGILPHTFFFIGAIVYVEPHHAMQIAARGDFDGLCDMCVTPNGDGTCDAHFRWRINIRQPYIRPLIRALRPVFLWNHRAMMRRVHRQFQQEIDRRRRGSNRFTLETATFPHNIPFFRRSWKRIGASVLSERTVE